MGKTLILIRHGKSDWSNNGEKDFDRPLNNRGNMDAPRMGGKLHDMGIMPDLIVSSPSLRTTLTAEYICEQIHYPFEKVDFQEDIYEASVRTLLKVVNELDEKNQTVIIVGHNPGFSYLAEYLSGTVVGNIPTCGIVELTFDLDTWSMVSQNTAKLKNFIYPKMFFGGGGEQVEQE
ncbi:SixA phosphatase family protein [Cytophaga hutchinsonii]|uniref:Phosphohistidine phosphatase n=1 Tax=Cytophaga hutchinsonii (strain ATCC 33406 / DSM 1761 / CIP 103989 / NBRC 15051 / NCIMB 9469 / D465) TaxID=269798 RepID=A0A6N4ST55_CYTH3|nr:histidine phosphatase family protein [Cytophaga hutchinsonii]ABG59600.1 phosphohistidine phosphatase [Cytophaga hutchinsonii ATCC 33406]SFX67419.1 phosphohistidine phosphatase [Cytophaga hutchinsonii ATCC 33406]